ncbi:hypothetical protein ACULNC_04605 [Shigella flexneri]
MKSGSTTQASVMLALSQSAVSAALTDLKGSLAFNCLIAWGKDWLLMNTAAALSASVGTA